MPVRLRSIEHSIARAAAFPLRRMAMTELPANLVIRRAAPLRRLLIVAAAVAAGAALLYLTYERGRNDGGYDRVSAAQERETLQASIAKLERANASLSARVAELDTLRIGRAQERSELAHTIGDLQAQVARQSQEIAFYRSVMSEGVAPRGDGLELQQVRITPGSAAGHFLVHLTLLERTRPESEAKGTFQLGVEGTENGKPVTLDQAALTGGKAHSGSFSFRYFESLDEEIALPQGFHPERLTIVAQTRGRSSAAPLTQTFAWHVDTQ